VTRCLGPAIAERAQRIASAESEIDAPAPAARTDQTLGGSSASTTGIRARKSKRIWWAVAASSAALLLIGSLALGGGHGADPTPVASTPVASTPVKPSAAPEATKPAAAVSDSPITVMLRASPPKALLYLDNGPALPNPYQLTVIPDTNPHQLRASAPGFADRVEDLRLDSSKEVQLTLSTLAVGAHPASMRPKASAQPTITHTAPTPPGPGDMPKVITKRPRVLDPDNPFGAP
jgi:hypothetical protein